MWVEMALFYVTMSASFTLGLLLEDDDGGELLVLVQGKGDGWWVGE